MELVTRLQSDRQRPAFFFVSLKKPKTSKLMTYKEITGESAENHTKQTNAFCGQSVEYFSVKPAGK